MRCLHVLAALLLAITTYASPAWAESAPLTLTVRLYNSVGMSADEIVAARGIAAPILLETGIDVSFRYCRMFPADTEQYDACAQSLGPNEVVVRMIDAPEPVPGASELAFGYSYVVNSTDRGWLATVYVDRIRVAASRVGLERARLLGMVVAHEVGHLLLGQEHSETGLMAPQWHDLSLRRLAQGHDAASAFRFTPGQAAAIQERIVDR